MPLNPKQERFCNEYLIDLNATQAAIRAGYSAKTANRIGNENLSKLDIQKYIQDKKEKLAEKTNITLEMVTEGYRRLAFYDGRNFYDNTGQLKKIPDLDDETAFALTGFEIAEERIETKKTKKLSFSTKKIKTSDRRSALDSLCKVLGYFAPDKVANVTADGKDVIPQKTLSNNQFTKLISAINEAGSR